MVLLDQSSTHHKHDSSLQFLQRWYNITEALIAVTPAGLPGYQPTYSGPSAPIMHPEGERVCIDVYTGCAEDLSAIFREIGALAWERRCSIDDAVEHPRLSGRDFMQEAAALELSVRRMMKRDKSPQILFNISGAHDLSLEQSEEFLLCNEAYQHTALIHIYRRIGRLPSLAPVVQESVRRIIECVERIKPAATLSPLTLVTTPLFTAGCEADVEGRGKAARLLNNMYAHLRLPNMKRALDVLEAFWNESEDSGIDWEEFSRMIL